MVQACLCAGTQDAVMDSLSKHYKREEIGHMTCLGRCHENAAFHIGGVNYSGEAANNLSQIVSTQGALQPKDQYNVGSNKEVLTAPFADVDAFYGLLNDVFKQSRSKF